MNRRHLRHAQAVLGVAILLLGIAASPAVAAEEPKQEAPGTAPEERPPGGFRTWDELAEAQDKLNNAADRILSADSPGYAGTVAAPETGTLVIYWKGTVPPDAQERARATGVPVKFNQARFSLAELGEETNRLGADKRVFSAAPRVDGAGIDVAVGSDADREAVLAEARLPLNVTVDRSAPQLLWNRQNDISPYWGGARWDNLSTGSYCSTGFGLNFYGLQMMLSAAHCANPGNVARIGAPGQPNTSIAFDVNPRDTLLINRPPNRAFQGRIYSGGLYSTSSYKVIGAAADYVGNYVCTGGARTGEHCNAKVQAVNVSVLGITPLTLAAAAPGTCIAAPGDSGGPTYTPAVYNAGGPFLQYGAVARGTVTAGYMDTPCIADSGSRNPPPVLITGSYRVFYAPVLRPFFDPHVGSLQFYGATLL